MGPSRTTLAVGFIWLWWINLYNFMDGIDGIAGSEAAAIGGRPFAAGHRSAMAPISAWLCLPPQFLALRWAFWYGIGRRPGFFWAMSAACRLGYLTGFLLIGARQRWPLEGRTHPAALFSRRRDDHLGAPPAARREGMAGTPPAFLSTGGHAGLGHAAVVAVLSLPICC